MIQAKNKVFRDYLASNEYIASHAASKITIKELDDNTFDFQKKFDLLCKCYKNVKRNLDYEPDDIGLQKDVFVVNKLIDKINEIYQ